ncbi:hypothetical protein HY949_02195 [Candidatus Gottesmanbacteria bacterium]|nr:hypothetical protein [Candidatus Gottesmanbacteria bacterium]
MDKTKDELRTLQLFTLDGVKAAMGIRENPTFDDVVQQFGDVKGKIDQDLPRILCVGNQ